MAALYLDRWLKDEEYSDLLNDPTPREGVLQVLAGTRSWVLPAVEETFHRGLQSFVVIVKSDNHSRTVQNFSEGVVPRAEAVTYENIGREMVYHPGIAGVVKQVWSVGRKLHVFGKPQQVSILSAWKVSSVGHGPVQNMQISNVTLSPTGELKVELKTSQLPQSTELVSILGVGPEIDGTVLIKYKRPNLFCVKDRIQNIKDQHQEVYKCNPQNQALCCLDFERVNTDILLHIRVGEIPNPHPNPVWEKPVQSIPVKYEDPSCAVRPSAQEGYHITHQPGSAGGHGYMGQVGPVAAGNMNYGADSGIHSGIIPSSSEGHHVAVNHGHFGGGVGHPGGMVHGMQQQQVENTPVRAQNHPSSHQREAGGFIQNLPVDGLVKIVLDGLLQTSSWNCQKMLFSHSSFRKQLLALHKTFSNARETPCFKKGERTVGSHQRTISDSFQESFPSTSLSTVSIPEKGTNPVTCSSAHLSEPQKQPGVVQRHVGFDPGKNQMVGMMPTGQANLPQQAPGSMLPQHTSQSDPWQVFALHMYECMRSVIGSTVSNIYFLVPTKEVGQRVADVLNAMQIPARFLKGGKLTIKTLEDHLNTLRVLVMTPGTLMNLVEQNGANDVNFVFRTCGLVMLPETIPDSTRHLFEKAKQKIALSHCASKVGYYGTVPEGRMSLRPSLMLTPPQQNVFQPSGFPHQQVMQPRQTQIQVDSQRFQAVAPVSTSQTYRQPPMEKLPVMLRDLDKHIEVALPECVIRAVELVAKHLGGGIPPTFPGIEHAHRLEKISQLDEWLKMVEARTPMHRINLQDVQVTVNLLREANRMLGVVRELGWHHLVHHLLKVAKEATCHAGEIFKEVFSVFGAKLNLRAGETDPFLVGEVNPRIQSLINELGKIGHSGYARVVVLVRTKMAVSILGATLEPRLDWRIVTLYGAHPNEEEMGNILAKTRRDEALADFNAGGGCKVLITGPPMSRLPETPGLNAVVYFSPIQEGRKEEILSHTSQRIISFDD